MNEQAPQQDPKVLTRMVQHLSEQLAQSATNFALNVAMLESQVEKAEAEITRLRGALAKAQAPQAEPPQPKTQ